MKQIKLIRIFFLFVLLLSSCQSADYKLYPGIKLKPASRKGSLASKRTFQSLLYEVWRSGFIANNDLTKQEILNNTYGVFQKAERVHSEAQGRAFYQQRTGKKDVLMLNANLFGHLKLPPKPGRLQKSLISSLDGLIRDTLVHELYHDFWYNIMDQRRKDLFASEAEIFLIEIELIKASAEINKLKFLERIGFNQPEIDYFRFLGALLDLKKTYSLEKAIGTELYATLAGRTFSGATIIPEQLRKYYLSVVSTEALFENRFFNSSDAQHNDKRDRAKETQDFPKLELSLEEQPELLESEDENGSTLLHHASYAGNEEAVQFLADKGANVNTRATSCSWTPLFLASLSGHTEIVKLLIDNGARIDVKDSRGRSPLHIAAMGGHRETVDILLRKGIDANLKDEAGMTSLHTAALCGKSQAASLLLSKGAAAGTVDHQGQTPLHIASLNGSRDLVKLLIMEGIDIDKRDISGETSLHIAAFCGHNDVVELLIERGANPYIQNKYGLTPMEIASKAGHRKIFARLSEIAAALN